MNIEQAIEQARKCYNGCGMMNSDNKDFIDTVIAALRSQAEKENLKPLTLEEGFEIINADGTPIDYDALGKKYKDQICYCDIDGFYIGGDGQLVLLDDCGGVAWVDRGDYKITARCDHEPKEGKEG